MATALDDLIRVIEEARDYVARPDADFDWSTWPDQEAALSEIDAALGRLRRGQIPASLDVLFLPTGPLQEVALSSGWGDDFLELANRFDDCVSRARTPET